MRILALVPARKGSKRLPRKNLLQMNGKPLFQWSIELAINIPEISNVMVSTDDPLIAELSRGCGALAPWLRPSELASDTARSVDVALHALDWYEKEHGQVDGLLLLQPTSPFRKLESVRRGIEIFRAAKGGSVVGVSPARSHPMWTYQIEGLEMYPFCIQEGVNGRTKEVISQALPKAYVINGAFYLIDPKELRKHDSFLSTNTSPLIMTDPLEEIDIDTLADFRYAEYLKNIS